MLSSLLSNWGLSYMGWKSVQFACGFGASFLIVMFCGRWFINKMGDWQKKGQPIREDGPQTHLVKAGTPTMGGVLILAAVLVSSLLFMDYHNPIGWIALASLVLFGAVGFSDDLGKVKKQSAYSGMSARGRLALEFLIAAALAFLIDKTMPMYVPNLSLVIPGVHVIWGLGVFYFLFAYIVIAGSANAANITDGLDGMLSKTILPVIAVLGVALYGATHLNIIWNGLVFLPEAVVLYPIMGAVVGAVLGFLWFNAAPASIFMGDVGSLALGGFMGTVAMILKAEIIMGIAALMMVTILASSFVQTTVFKLTKRGARPGRRIFKMAPLHHHFELCGWAETKVVERFLILSVLFSGLALIVMKI